jgi:hypothetical protein
MKKALLCLAVVVSSLLVIGCSSPPTRFFVLSNLAVPAQRPSSVGQDIAIGVGPLEFPDYLDRPQIVTRTGQNELYLAEFDKWGESLMDNATQVLAEDLASLLGSKKVNTYPWKRSTPIDYQLVAKVIRFDHMAGSETVLNTRWSILSGDGRTELVMRQSRYAEPQAGESYAATVAAMNRTLARFGREVASAITDLHTHRSGIQP